MLRPSGTIERRAPGLYARLSRMGAGLLVLAGAAALTAGPAWAQEGRFERTLSVSGPVTLDARTGSGSITVRRGDAGSVHITGTIRAQRRWWGTGDVEQYIRQVEAQPPIVQDGNTVRIELPDDETIRQRISISYEVTVPGTTDVAAESGSGSISIDGLERSARARTGSGSVQVSNVGGAVDAHTGSGRVAIEAAGGDVEAATGSGAIEARRVGGTLTASTGSGSIRGALEGQGTVNARTGSGSIQIDGARGALQIRSGSGSIKVAGDPGGDWSIETGSGGITLDLPEKAAFRIDAQARSGAITVDHPVTVSGAIERRRVRGTVGDGGSLLALSTGSGSITVR